MQECAAARLPGVTTPVPLFTSSGWLSRWPASSLNATLRPPPPLRFAPFFPWGGSPSPAHQHLHQSPAEARPASAAERSVSSAALGVAHAAHAAHTALTPDPRLFLAPISSCEPSLRPITSHVANPHFLPPRLVCRAVLSPGFPARHPRTQCLVQPGFPSPPQSLHPPNPWNQPPCFYRLHVCALLF